MLKLFSALASALGLTSSRGLNLRAPLRDRSFKKVRTSSSSDKLTTHFLSKPIGGGKKEVARRLKQIKTGKLKPTPPRVQA
jgi:hypothetical protein